MDRLQSHGKIKLDPREDNVEQEQNNHKAL